MRLTVLCFLTIITLLVARGQQNDCTKLSGISKVVCLAEAFKSTLTKEQLAQVQLEYSKGDAMRWSNFPQAFARPSRVGLGLGTLNSQQMTAFKSLMASVLSNDTKDEGFDELEGELAADSYFGEKTGKTNTFGSSHYVIVFLGKPSTTGLWELMFGGHHFAFANTYKGGKLIGATPSFRGVEPLGAVTVSSHIYQPLDQERQAFSEVINSLSDTQRSAAKVSAPGQDILLGPGEDGRFPTTKQGIRIGDLNAEQRNKIISAIKLYVNDLDSATANPLMRKYLTGLSETFLSFAGSGTMDQSNDYIRLDGPDLWIEYSAQPSRDFPGTTHPHSVWRDRKTDYGSN